MSTALQRTSGVIEAAAACVEVLKDAGLGLHEESAKMKAWQTTLEHGKPRISMLDEIACGAREQAAMLQVNPSAWDVVHAFEHLASEVEDARFRRIAGLACKLGTSISGNMNGAHHLLDRAI